MKFYTLTFILVATFAVMALAEPEPEPAKASRYRAAQIIEDADADDENIDNNQKDTAAAADASNDGSKKGDASSGRLFAKKFLLFKNIFGNNQQQPIIPIIITGTNAGTAVTPPTTTVTSTATIPTGTGTITTSPATATASPTGTASPTVATPTAAAGKRVVKPQQQLAPRGSYENNDNENENSENGSEDNDESGVVDEQALAAALAAGAEEYVVTEQEIKGTSDGKAIRGPARVNLRRRGNKNGKVVSVRIPPKYRRYFKNGQRVVLNNRNRPQKRRVVRKRVNRNRNKKNKNRNKRRRIVAA